MRIVETNRLSQTRTTRRTGAVDGSGFAGLLGADEPAGAAPPARVSSLASVGVLLAAQSVEDATAGRSRAVRRGHDLLDDLDALKRDVALGEVSVARLQQLAGRARQERDAGLDTQLTDILDQIDLRVAVELAKLGVSI
jgi:hypothetical protein